jgi:hypothetical protein
MAVLDSLAKFPIIGFAISYLALEGDWHFAVCRINNPNLAPCIFKQAKMLIAGTAAGNGQSYIPSKNGLE